MRLPRIRFTLRSLMAAIAVVAIAISGTLWGLKMRRLSRLFGIQAQGHKQLETWCRQSEARSLKSLAEFEGLGRRLRELPHYNEEDLGLRLRELPHYNEVEGMWAGLEDRERRFAGLMARRGDHYARLNQKYDRAARYPWLTVAPDPPLPQ